MISISRIQRPLKACFRLLYDDDDDDDCDSVIIRVGSVFIYFFISFIRVSDRARVSTGSAQLCEIFVGIAKSRKSARA